MDAQAKSRLIRAVQTARRKAGIDDARYRDMLAGLTGHASTRDCTAAELGRMLDAINGGGAPGRPRADGEVPKKVRALVLSLWNLGAWRDPSEKGIAAFVSGQVHVDALQWLKPEHTSAVVDALRAICARNGFDVPSNVRPDDAERALIRAQLARLEALDADAGAQQRPLALAAEDSAGRRAVIRRLGMTIRARMAA